jgi:hypothetical protein
VRVARQRHGEAMAGLGEDVRLVGQQKGGLVRRDLAGQRVKIIDPVIGGSSLAS